MDGHLTGLIRTAARAGAPAAVATVVALAAQTPASTAVPAAHAVPSASRADGDGVRLSIDAPEATGLYGVEEGAEGRQDEFSFLVQPKGGVAKNVEVTVDARALLGTGTLKPGHRCTAEQGTEGVFHCVFDPRSLRYAAHVKPFHLRGKNGVRPGDGGTVRLTARADNAPEVRARTRMEVRPPELTAHRSRWVPGRFGAGSPVPLRPSFANTRRWTVPSAGFKVSAYGDNVKLAAKYRNCWYRDPDAGPVSTEETAAVWCGFDTPLPPHSAWRTAGPLTGRLDPDMPAESMRYELTYEPRDKKVFTRRGTGPELKLERIPAKSVRGTGPHGALLVRGTAQLDYTPVVHGTVRGEAGKTATVRVGVRNVNGGRLPGPNPDRFEITPPEGTTVTGTPYTVDGDPMDGACEASRSRKGVQVCPLSVDAFENIDGRKGAETTVKVRFRIDRKVPGARGSVRAVGKYDRTHGNDTARLRTDVSGAAGAGDGGDGGFPVVPVAAAGGAVAVAGAVGGVVLVRRRRSRAES